VVQSAPADRLDKEGLQRDLDELLRQPESTESLSQLIKKSRRWGARAGFGESWRRFNRTSFAFARQDIKP
jgi:hypothetical protein